MKINTLNIIILILHLTLVSFGQGINVETDKFKGTKKLIVKTFNGCCSKKGYKAIYYFDSIGRTIKSFNYFKRKLLSSYEYSYNEKGFLSEEIEIYIINKKSSKDTIKFTYTFDQSNRVTTKTKYLRESFGKETYTDFDSLNRATKIVSTFYKDSIVTTKQFHPKNEQIFIERFRGDNLKKYSEWSEEIKYNKFGDIIYSYKPSLIDKETGKMVQLIGGNRHWYLEQYEYTYNKNNRWTEKYVVYENKKVLLEKRIYK